MPNASDLAIKKKDGTTTVTFKCVTASGGDRVPAVFRNDASSTIPRNRSTFKIVARSNQTNSVRRVETEFLVPYIVTVDGKETVAATMPISVSAGVPQIVPDSFVEEVVAEWVNLHATELVKACLAQGYAPV